MLGNQHIQRSTQPFVASISARIPKWIQANSKPLVLLALLIVSIEGIIFRVNSNFESTDSISLDYSWMLSLPALLRQGIVLGRDSMEHYGPLSQLVYGLGASFNVHGSLVSSLGLIEFTTQAFSFVLLAVLLLMIRPLRWPYAVFVFVAFGVLLNFEYSSFRPLALLVYAVFLGNVLAVSQRRARNVQAGLAGFVMLGAQLLSVEIGLYALVLTVGFLGFFTFCALFPKILQKDDLLAPQHYLEIGLIVGLTFFILNVVLSGLFALTARDPVGFFDYQRASLELIFGFNATMGVAWMLSLVPTLSLLVVFVFINAYVLLNLRFIKTAYGYMLMALLTDVWMQLKSGLTRADAGHIELMITPLILLLLVLGWDWLAGRRVYWRNAWAVVLLGFFIDGPFTNASPLVDMWHAARRPDHVAAAWQSLTQFVIPVRQLVSADLDAALDPEKTVITYPFGNYIPIALNRAMRVPIITGYDVYTIALQNWYINALERHRSDLEIVHSADLPFGNSPEITRLPVLFTYFYQHFTLKKLVDGGRRAVLQARGPSNTVSDWRAVPLQFSVEQPANGQTIVRLAKPAACSLIQITPTISYPVTSFIGRPDGLHSAVLAGDSLVAFADIAPLERGQPFTTYLSLLDGSHFVAQIYGTDPVPTYTWDSIELSTNKTDLLGVAPSDIRISDIKCITFARGGSSPIPFVVQPTPNDPVYDFKDTTQWVALNMALAPDGTRQNWVAQIDPALEYIKPLDMCLADYRAFSATLSVPEALSPTYLQLFYKLNGQPSASGEHSFVVPILADDRPHRYIIPITPSAFQPNDRLTGFRFDPIDKGDGVQPIRLLDFRLIAGETGHCTSQTAPPSAPPSPTPPPTTTFQATAHDLTFDLQSTSLWKLYRLTLSQDANGPAWIAANDPQFEYIQPIDVCMVDYSAFSVTLAVPASLAPTGLQVFYRLNGETTFSEAHSFLVPVITDGQAHMYTMDIARLNVSGQDYLTGIRYDPIYNGDGTTPIRLMDFRLIAASESKRCQATP